MKYRLIYTQRAIRDIKKLEVATRTRIGKTLQRYQDEPLKHAGMTVWHDTSVRHAREGGHPERHLRTKYSILNKYIFDIVDNDIIVLRVGHRNEIYKG